MKGVIIFNLTQQERQIIAFIIAVAIFGIGANCFFKKYPCEEIISDHLTDSKESGLDQVNLNNATIARLISLPGIGVKTAERIVEYRLENGPFSTIEQLKTVKGIGTVKFDRIKEYLVIK